jgi:hypothetical protein
MPDFLTSAVVGPEFSVPVWLPPGYSESNQSFPVLYAPCEFLLRNGRRHCHVPTEAEIPEIIVVGVYYPVQL